MTVWEEKYMAKKSTSPLAEKVLVEKKETTPKKKSAVKKKTTPKKKGVFPFSCGMSMFHGKLIVK